MLSKHLAEHPVDGMVAYLIRSVYGGGYVEYLTRNLLLYKA